VDCGEEKQMHLTRLLTERRAKGMARMLSLFVAVTPFAGAFGFELPADLGARSHSISSPRAKEEASVQEPEIAVTGDATIPFRLRSGFLIVVEGRIGPLDSLKFVLDTGTTHSMMDTKLADRLNLSRQEGTVLNFDQPVKVGWTTVSELELGPLKARNLRLMVGPLGRLTEFADEIDAVIGLDVLRLSRSLRVDFDQNLLTLRARTDSDPPDTKNTQVLLLHLNAQGQRICLVLDTGLGQMVMFKDRLHKHFPHLELTGVASEAHQGHLNGQMVNLRGIRLGSDEAEARVFLIERAPASLPDDIDGFLGVRAFHIPIVELNFEANNLALGGSESTRASLMKLDTLKTDSKQGAVPGP